MLSFNINGLLFPLRHRLLLLEQLFGALFVALFDDSFFLRDFAKLGTTDSEHQVGTFIGETL